MCLTTYQRIKTEFFLKIPEVSFSNKTTYRNFRSFGIKKFSWSYSGKLSSVMVISSPNTAKFRKPYTYEFRKRWAVENNSEQLIHFNYRTSPLVNYSSKHNVKMKLGYHIAPFEAQNLDLAKRFLEETLMYRKYKGYCPSYNEIVYLIVRFEEEDVQMFDGQDIVVKTFAIATKKEAEVIAKYLTPEKHFGYLVNTRQI